MCRLRQYSTLQYTLWAMGSVVWYRSCIVEVICVHGVARSMGNII